MVPQSNEQGSFVSTPANSNNTNRHDNNKNNNNETTNDNDENNKDDGKKDDNDDDDDDDCPNTHTTLDSLQWSLTWTMAFPTLLPSMVYVEVEANVKDEDDDDDDDEEENNKMQYHPPLSLSDLAYQRLFPSSDDHPKTVTNPIDIPTRTSTSTSILTPYSIQHQSDRDSDSDSDSNSHSQGPYDSLGYGEITPRSTMEVLHQIFRLEFSNFQVDVNVNVNVDVGVNAAKEIDNLPVVPLPSLLQRGVGVGGGTVVDLGSGEGSVLFAAALVHPFDVAMGVEIVDALHETALRRWKHWKREELGTTGRTEFRFVRTDLRLWRPSPPSPVDLVFVHGTLFDPSLMESVQTFCESCGCQQGTLFVMVSRALNETETNGIVTLDVRERAMTWGVATVFLQMKVGT